MRRETKKGLGFPRSLISLVPEVGLEPTRVIHPLDFESSASTNFTTPAIRFFVSETLSACQSDFDIPCSGSQNYFSEMLSLHQQLVSFSSLA